MAAYPKDVCKAGCTAIMEQKMCDEGHRDPGYISRGKNYDETSGKELDGIQVQEARQLELKYSRTSGSARKRSDAAVLLSDVWACSFL